MTDAPNDAGTARVTSGEWRREPSLWVLPIAALVIVVGGAVFLPASHGIGCSLPWDVYSYYGAARPGMTAIIWVAYGVWLIGGWWPFALGWGVRRRRSGAESRAWSWWRSILAALYGSAWLGVTSIIPSVFFTLPAGSDTTVAPGCFPTPLALTLVLFGFSALVVAFLLHVVLWTIKAVLEDRRGQG